MSRYLTPGKIALLAVISLYADSVVPTIAIIPLLSSVIPYVLSANGCQLGREGWSGQLTATLSLEGLQASTISYASAIPGRTLWDLLLKKLWEIHCFDALEVFFDSLGVLLLPFDSLQGESQTPGLQRIKFSRTSPFGAFVRRAQLEFARLQFDDGIALWKSFVTYRIPTLSMWRRRNPGAGKACFDVNLTDELFGKSEKLFTMSYGDLETAYQQEHMVSGDDVEKFLDRQKEQMQTMGIRLTQDIRETINTVTRTRTVMPASSYYVKFLDLWKSGEYPSSFDHLHRYFDYIMLNGDRTFYQYALLNLAILHKDFGCLSEAITAIEETIGAARENKDTACLNFSLSWLFQLGQAHPNDINVIQSSGLLGTDKEALIVLKTKAKESEMWSLLSASLLNEARMSLTAGEALPAAFESITKQSYLNLKKRIFTCIGSEMGMQSTLFSRLGLSYLAWSYNELFLECYKGSSPTDDTLHAKCRKATALILKGSCREDLRRLCIDDDEPDRTLKQEQFWMSHLSLLRLRQSLNRNDFSTAEHILLQLKGSQPPDPEITSTLELLEVNFYVRNQNYAKAMELLDKHAIVLQRKDSDVYQRIRLMTLKGHICSKAGIPQKGLALAIRAASQAYKARLLPVLWDAIVVLCKVLISIREFEGAMKLLVSVMPQVLECEDCSLAANSYACLADAHMGLAGQSSAGLMRRKEHMTKASEYLEKAFEQFSRVEDVMGQCEVLAKKAMIMYLNGDMVLANDYGARYQDIQQAASQKDTWHSSAG